MYLSLSEIRQMDLDDTIFVSKIDILLQMTRCNEENINFKSFFLCKALPAMMTYEKELFTENHGIGHYSMDYVKTSVQHVLAFFDCTKVKESKNVFLVDDMTDYKYTSFSYKNMTFIHIEDDYMTVALSACEAYADELDKKGEYFDEKPI
ncbi:MAG: hypothetical protein Q4E61_03295 [Alphaproteobacteria bacterium]|nr:hypothetical protein [Alphaproteobacteria bacterium]